MNLPNQLTILRILLTPLFVFLLFSSSSTLQWLSFAVFVIASLTDWYDGYIARKFGVVTKWGKFLDPLADKILVSSAFICFCVMGYFHAWMVTVVVVRDVIITVLRSYAVYKGAPITTSTFAKVKTFSQVVFLYLVYLYILYTNAVGMKGIQWIFNTESGFHLMNIGMLFISIVTAASGLLYLVDNRSCVADMKKDLFRLIVPSNTRV